MHESASGVAWRIELYNSMNLEDKYKIESMDYYVGESLPITSGLVGLPAGTYYIKIESRWYVSVGKKYELTVNYEKSDNWEKEIDSETARNKLSLGETMYESIQNGISLTDYYEFTLPSAGKVDFTFEHDYESASGVAWRIELYNSSSLEEKYKIESMDYYVGESLPVTSGLVGLPAGTYYVKLSNRWDVSTWKR